MINDKYQRVDRKKNDAPMLPNEIRINGQGFRKNYISYALNLLTRPEKPEDTILLRAMGRAINKAVSVAEIVKRRVAGLHQVTEITSAEIIDTYEPLEEGLKTVENKRVVPAIAITLSRNPLDSSSPGYQAPLPSEAIQADRPSFPGTRGRGRGGRGRGRGRGRGGYGYNAGFNGNPSDNVPATGNFYRGRGGRGRGRGGFYGGFNPSYGGNSYNNGGNSYNNGGSSYNNGGGSSYNDGNSSYNNGGGYSRGGRGGYGRGRGGRGRGRGFYSNTGVPNNS